MTAKTNSAGMEINAETLHGIHYQEADFLSEVKNMVDEWIEEEREEGTEPTKADIDNAYFNFRREVYSDWNECTEDELNQWELANSHKDRGHAVAGFTKASDENPLLAPIHGISLRDYAAMALKLASGADLNAVCKAMGIEPAIWSELNVLWPQRMQQDNSFTVTTLYGQYFMEGAKDPRLENLDTGGTTEGKANLEKIKTDRLFFEELNGARAAAYEYGLDGAQWILDNYGISLGDFQAVTMQWMTAQNQNFNSDDIMKYLNYQQEKQAEYAKKFAAEQGGNVADDIDF